MNLIRNEKNQILKREQFWLNPEYEIIKTKSIWQQCPKCQCKQWLLLVSGSQVPLADHTGASRSWFTTVRMRPSEWSSGLYLASQKFYFCFTIHWDCVKKKKRKFWNPQQDRYICAVSKHTERTEIMTSETTKAPTIISRLISSSSRTWCQNDFQLRHNTEY